MNVIKPNTAQLPVIDISKCTLCDQCLNICPQKAIVKVSSSSCAKCIKYCITMKVPCNPEHYVFCYETCDACGLCASVCKQGAIYWYKISQ